MKQGATSIPAVKSSENGLSSVQTKNGGKPFFSSFIQTKLSINPPGDSYEQEADTMAEKVMRMPASKNESSFFKSSFSTVQRKCDHCEEEEKKLRRKEIKPDHDHEQKVEVSGENGLLEASQANELSHSKSSIIQRACAQCEEEEKKVHRKEKNHDESFEPATEPGEDTMMRSPLHTHENGSSHSSFIQRQCADCEEEEKKLRRKEKNGHGVSSTQRLESYVGNLQTKGESLSPAMRGFFEPRFNQDFSNVKVHTNSEAAQSAQSINALAYTKGSDIVFNNNQYSPNTYSGKKLLAHELTHVVQQNGNNTVSRKPGDRSPGIPQETSGERDIDIFSIKAAYRDTMEDVLQHVLIVNGAVGQLYDVSGENPSLLGSYSLRHIVFPNLYLIQLFTGKFMAVGMADVEQADGSKISEYTLMDWGQDTPEEKKTAEEVDKELTIATWFANDTEKEKFFAKATSKYAIIINPPGKSKSPQQTPDEKPILSTNYPPWFRELKKKIEALIAEQRKTNNQEPNLPDQIHFYGSDKVQAEKGPDAWTIQVNKGKDKKYITVLKQQWEAAEDKDAYASSILQQLLKKVKFMNDDAELKKEEEKELSELKQKGEGEKGNKYAWAIKLKNEIETIITEQRRREKTAKDFPDKLSLATQQGQGEGGNIFLRVGVYKEKEGAKPQDIPDLSSGTLPAALKEIDKAADWVPIVRKAAAALRTGAITYDPYQETDKNKKDGDATILPPYPAFIRPMNMNPDRTTATIASNNFRMVLDTASVHGSNMLNLTLIHMGMTNVYAWRVYHLPEELKGLKKNPETTPAQLATAANDYTREHPNNLGLLKKGYEADYDWEQEIKMNDLGEGEFLVTSGARVYYKEDWNIKRQGSIAGIPISVKKAEDMASQAALADTNYIEELKKRAENEKEPKKKALLLQQISELEAREKKGLLELTRKDAKETEDLINYARALKTFILDDRKRKIDPAGNKDFDPFLIRLKAVDQKLYSLYLLIRQVYDYSYGDLYAVDEYTKLLTDQYNQLQKLDKRIVRMTANENFQKDKPTYRCVAALVREDDGNLVPLILMMGHHKESLKDGKYKMMLLDMTFDSKKGDMTYVGGEFDNEAEAVRSAFVKFGEDNNYGEGKIVYRVANTNYRGNVGSVKTAGEYLAQALAVIGIALLIAGTIISAGALAPATAAALGTVVTYLGIATAVAGAVLAAKNISDRREKGTFEMDAEFALDVVSIIGAFVQVAGTAGRAMATFSRTMGAVQKVVTVQRLDKLLLIYDAVELGGNAVLIGMKVHDDIAAVKDLHLPKEQEDEMMQQIMMEAMQQGAMLAHASFSKVKDIAEHITAKIEKSKYQSFREKKWVDEHNHPTENAPPFLKHPETEPGKTPSKAQQGERAWKESQAFEMAKSPTADKEHNLTITEKGRIIRCSDFCSDLRMKFSETLEKDPWLNEKMTDLETKAKAAAKSGNKEEANNVAKAASAFEAQLKEADELRKHLFGFTDKELNDALEGMEAGKVTGGPKSGRKIDDVRIPKRQRRQVDVSDLMTEDELKELGKGGFKKALDRVNQVMGKKISDIKELEKHWAEARKAVLKGKEPTDYNKDTVIGMYKDAQRKFWENVRNDPAAVDFLKKQGFELEGERGAAMAVLGPQGKQTTERGNVTNQERRISLDHKNEKAQGENWKQALDADNLELMFQNANSWKEIVQVKFGMRDKEAAVQPKLAINQPGDSYEQEADQMAETVMRMPANNNGNIFRELDKNSVQTKCAECEEEEKEKDVQRKEKNGKIVFTSPQVEKYVNGANSNGQALPAEARNYFEPRFGYDFSKVKIHTNAEANKSAQSINAHAYTSANNIVFNQDQFSPNSDNGKKLLAHELTHVVQQGSASKNGSSSEGTVQRKPQQMDKIRDRLTRSFGDWAVTDQDVNDVLLILDPMKDPDFKDTIAAMDNEKLVQELYDEISDDDKANFAVLLRRIQMNRVRTLPDGKKIVDSCLPERRKKIDETLADVKAWAKKCFEAVNSYAFYLGMSSSPPDANIASAMEANFFHEAKNGKLPDATKIKFANQIADNYKKVEEQKGSFTQVCVNPYDPLCAALALAFVSHSDNTVNYCTSFFSDTKTREDRALTVFHEFFHAFAFVRDTGYGHERVYQYLMPVDAINNAASYENFAVQIKVPKDQKVPVPVSDVVNDCTADQAQIIRKRIAFGARMITSALNVIGSPTSASNQTGGETDQFFKTIVRSELTRVIDRFKEVDTAFNQAIEIECETNCDKGEIAYNRTLGSFVHICPTYFSLGEDGQVDWMLLYIADRKTGGNIKDQPGSSAFGKQDKDAAYKNLWTYISYARAVSEKDTAWKYVQAEFRYERELQSNFDELSKILLDEITAEQLIRNDVRSKYVNVLQTALSNEIASKKIESATGAESTKKNYIGKLNDLMKIASVVSDEYTKFDTEAFVKWMLADKADLTTIDKILEKMKKKVKEELIQELDKQFKLIQAGTKVDFNGSATVMKNITKGYIDKLKLLDGYLPLLRQISSIDEPIEKYKDKLKSKLPASKQSDFETDYVFNMMMYFQFDKTSMEDDVAAAIINGKPFDPKAKATDPDAVIKKYQKELDEEFKKAKAKK